MYQCVKRRNKMKVYSNGIDIYAEYEHKNYDGGTVEIDLQFSGYEEAMAEARELMELDDDADNPEMVNVTAYATDSDVEHYAQKIDWFDLLATGKHEVIEDFLALDENDQLLVLFMTDYHGITLREAIESRDRSTIFVYGSEDEMIDLWLEGVDEDTKAFYIDKEAVLRDYYYKREVLPSGNIICVNE